MEASSTKETQEYISQIALDDEHVVRRKPEIEQERMVAIGDILRENQFAPICEGSALASGPYDVKLSAQDNRLIFMLHSQNLSEEYLIALPMSPFRSIIRDYFIICESYFDTLKLADPYKVEALDMGRRGIHNEGSELLQKHLRDKVEMDFNTARRIFTLMCVLHIK